MSTNDKGHSVVQSQGDSHKVTLRLNIFNLKPNQKMEEKIKELTKILCEAYSLKNELENKEFWIKKAKEEAGFIPQEGDWIHVEVTLFKIEVSVHHKNYGSAKYWKNGVWMDDPFSIKYPSLSEMI